MRIYSREETNFRPKKDPKRQLGAVQAKSYYTIRETRKGGMDAETFDTIAWDAVEAALEGTSKVFKMWYEKQGSGFCGVGYWTSKWEGNGDS